MNINADFIGQFVFATAIFCCLVGYFLGRRKTGSPLATAAIGFIVGLFPPFGAVFIIVLATKANLSSKQSS